MINRYSRQIIFPSIGKKGQGKLSGSYVVTIGCGALGTMITSSLVRAGVGKISIIDRDFIEYHNLQRQILFDEDDIKNQLPKAIAATQHLKRINSSVEIEGIVADVNHTNIETFIRNADLVLDGLDNFETRSLLNDAALKQSIPWIYGGAISSFGMTMTIIPGTPPCFRCIRPNPAGMGTPLTCETAGVIGPAPFVIGSLQAAEAIKILVGAKEINQDLIVIDVWDGTFTRIKVSPRPDCPACHGKYEFLEGILRVRAVALCGQNAVQVLNPTLGEFSLKELATRLEAVGKVNYNEYMLNLVVDTREMVIFPDGRAIVKNTTDKSLARGLYAKYIGA